MVNNSTNINKTNNHSSFQLIEHIKDHDVGNPYPGLGQTQKWVFFKLSFWLGCIKFCRILGVFDLGVSSFVVIDICVFFYRNHPFLYIFALLSKAVISCLICCCLDNMLSSFCFWFYLLLCLLGSRWSGELVVLMTRPCQFFFSTFSIFFWLFFHCPLESFFPLSVISPISFHFFLKLFFSPIEIYQHMSLFALYHLCLSAAVSEWVIPAITSSEQFYSYIMARARYISMNYYSIIFPIPSQPVLFLLLITTCFAEKPQMPIL